MKIIATIIPTDLVTNSLLPSYKPKQESGFQQVGGLVMIYFCFLFIASRTILKSHAEFNRLL